VPGPFTGGSAGLLCSSDEFMTLLTSILPVPAAVLRTPTDVSTPNHLVRIRRRPSPQLQLPYEEACNRALTKARLVGQTRPWCRRQPVKSVCHSAMARSKARSVAALTELQPHHDTASGTDFHSPRAIAIGRNTPGVSLCSCPGAS
jgi:hypothetical protein